MPTIANRIVCRLLGGTGRTTLVGAPLVKLPALLAPIGSHAIDAVIRLAAPLLDA
jgi:hypothetical protein